MNQMRNKLALICSVGTDIIHTRPLMRMGSPTCNVVLAVGEEKLPKCTPSKTLSIFTDTYVSSQIAPKHTLVE